MATRVEDVFGKITPPIKGVGGTANSAQDLGTLIAKGINLFLVAIGLLALVYMLWGTISWVTSGGEKEKLQKAQGRIRSAVVGIFLSIVVLVLFNTIFSLAFPNSGIITPNGGGFQFTLPTL